MAGDWPTFVYVHGRGTGKRLLDWRDVVREAIRNGGGVPPPVDGPMWVEVDYLDILADPSLVTGATPPPLNITEPDQAARMRYLDLVDIERAKHPSPPLRLPAETLAELLTTLVPDLPRKVLGLAGVRDLPDGAMRLMGDVGRYRDDHEYRSAILTRAFEAMPERGPIVLVGHSLGSVVAVDLLSRLTDDQHVALLLTLGCPLSYLHLRSIGLAGIDFNTPFPCHRVDRWINVVDVNDPVTGMVGLERFWHEVVDVPVVNPLKSVHDGRAYMGHAAVGRLIAEVLPDTSLPVVPDHLPGRTSGEAAKDDTLARITVHYANRLVIACNDQRRRELAYEVVRHLLKVLSAESGRRIDLDDCEMATGAWGRSVPDHVKLLVLTTLHRSDPFAPYDPDVGGGTAIRALDRVGEHMGLPKGCGVDIAELHAATQKALSRRSGLPVWGKALVAVGAIGAAAVAAPFAVVAFSAAGATGAAAATSGLAALGTGGMAGGLATIGAMSAGSGLLAAQLTGADSAGQALEDVVMLTLRVRVLRRWGGAEGETGAREGEAQLHSLRAECREEMEAHRPFTHPDSPLMKRMEDYASTVERAMELIGKHREGDREHGDVEAGSELELVVGDT